MEVSQPPNESDRLKALHALQILHSERLPEFDAVVEAIATVFDCPISLISIVGEDEQWFKAKCGLDADSTSRDVSFCQHAIHSNDLFVIPDARKDERFRDNPLVVGDPSIRFYAGCPISIDGENRLGTLCVIDRDPRSPSEDQLTQLKRFGKIVEGLIKSHRAELQVQDALDRAEAESRLATQESELLEEIATVSGVGGWELDLDTNQLIWTDKTRELHEVDADFVPSVDTALSFYAPEGREIISAAVARGIEEGIGWDVELPFITAKGNELWVRAAGRPILDNGRVCRLVGAFQDITERLVSEKAVRRSEAVQRTTLETLREGILVLSASGRIQSYNPAAAKLLGLADEAAAGQKIQDLIAGIQFHTEDGKVDHDVLARAAKLPHEVNNHIVKMNRPDVSSSVWLRIDANATAGTGGAGLDVAVVSLADITETKLQAETLQVVFDNIHGGLVYYDEDRRLAANNEYFQQLLKLPKEFIDRKASLQDVAGFLARRGDFGPGDPDKLVKERFSVFDNPEPHVYERAGPDDTTLEIRGNPTPSGGLVTSIFDITERKRTEQSLKISEAVNRATLAAVSEGILLFDSNGIIQVCNPAAAGMVGYRADELAGMAVQDLDINIQCSLNDLDCDPFVLAVDDPDFVTDLIANVTPHDSKTSIWLRVNARSIDPSEEFGLKGVVVSMADITETKAQADQLQTIFDNVPGGFAYFDASYQLAFYNDELIETLQVPRDLLEQKLHLLDYFKFNAQRGDYGPGDPEVLALERFKAYPPDQPHAFERSTSDGRYLDIRSTPLPSGGFIYNFFDISERRRMEEKIAESERQAHLRNDELEAILANMRQGVSVFDKTGRLSLWNQQYLEIFGKPEGEVRKGASLVELIEAEKARGEFEGDVKAHVMDLMIQLSAGDVVRSKFKHPSGRVVSAVHAPMPGGGWIGTHEDVTSQELAAEKIEYAAHHDMLTGLANRTLFNKTLDEALDRAIVSEHTGDLLLLDLDRFKPVNDTFGHDVGDEILKQVAERMKACVRSTDLIARLGGDEFAIILNCTGEHTAEIAARIVSNIERPFSALGHTVSIGVSVGISPIFGETEDVSPIIKQADIALYEVKKNGRNGFRFFDGNLTGGPTVN
ncbi:PAS-domain containing protein [uncultured Roseibium sp.]|uniref:PAS-domain containing protein n=1 Tax=uncultured Roseibium sp. TaxID=1936171 RepID=UPI00262B3B37|nr:PAS-domain containing protein [uncultured Roseibium sp.]